MGMRIGLLLVIGWGMGLTATLFHVFEHPVAGRDLILLGGGLFLVAKATRVIHDKLEGDEHIGGTVAAVSLGAVLIGFSHYGRRNGEGDQHHDRGGGDFRRRDARVR